MKEKNVVEQTAEEVFDKCKKLLFKKGKEYSDGFDCFHNFNTSAILLGCSPETALAGMMSKHTISIYDMCTSADLGYDYSLEQWDEKICDHINYLVLLRAMVAENK